MGWLIHRKRELRGWGTVGTLILLAVAVATAKPNGRVHGRELSYSQMSGIFGDAPGPQCWDYSDCEQPFPIYSSGSGNTTCQYCDDGDGGGWFEFRAVCCANGKDKQTCNPGGGGSGACDTFNIYAYPGYVATLGTCGECGGVGAAVKSATLCSLPIADGSRCGK